jgi:hypothetical protein
MDLGFDDMMMVALCGDTPATKIAAESVQCTFSDTAGCLVADMLSITSKINPTATRVLAICCYGNFLYAIITTLPPESSCGFCILLKISLSEHQVVSRTELLQNTLSTSVTFASLSIHELPVLRSSDGGSSGLLVILCVGGDTSDSTVGTSECLLQLRDCVGLVPILTVKDIISCGKLRRENMSTHVDAIACGVAQIADLTASLYRLEIALSVSYRPAVSTGTNAESEGTDIDSAEFMIYVPCPLYDNCATTDASGIVRSAGEDSFSVTALKQLSRDSSRITSIALSCRHSCIIALSASTGSCYWHMRLPPRSDFPGPMYPIGFVRISEVIDYEEAENEFDIMEASAVGADDSAGRASSKKGRNRTVTNPLPARGSKAHIRIDVMAEAVAETEGDEMGDAAESNARTDGSSPAEVDIRNMRDAGHERSLANEFRFQKALKQSCVRVAPSAVCGYQRRDDTSAASNNDCVAESSNDRPGPESDGFRSSARVSLETTMPLPDKVGTGELIDAFKENVAVSPIPVLFSWFGNHMLLYADGAQDCGGVVRE